MDAIAATPSARAGSRAGRRWSKRLGRHLAAPLGLVLLIVLWELAVKAFQIQPLLLPAPSAIVREYAEISQKGLLWGPLGETLRALAVGMLLAVAIGVPLGVLIGAVPLFDLLSVPYLWTLRVTPSIAIAPLLVIWIGLGFGAKVWMVFLSAGTIILLITQEGVKTVDDSLVRVARSFGASKRDIYLKVVLPYILPFIANAIRNGVGMGIVGVLVVEMFSTSGGLGFQVIRASQSYDSPRMFAYIIVLIVLSLGLISISRQLEARVSRWREEAYV